MKKILVYIVFAVLPFSMLQGQSVKVRSNECVELLNTVWILANGTSDTASYRAVTERFGSFGEHKAVSMLKISNRSVMHYSRNFENVVLPFTGLKMKIDDKRNITLNVNEQNKGHLSYHRFWVLDMMDELCIELGDFYRNSDFHEYYTSIDKENSRMISRFESNDDRVVDLSKVNGILGTDVKEVQFVAPITRLSKDYSVPFVFVDGELLPMFFDAESEMQHPSYFTPFNILSTNNKPVLGLLTALFVNENQSNGSTPGFVSAVFEILSSYCNDCDEQGFQLWNFMSKWVPLLIADEYYKDEPSSRIHYTNRADRYGFIWHSDAIEYMKYYYSNRDKYQRLEDFMPQLEAYVAYLPEILDDLMANYEVQKHPYVVSVYPAPNTELDMSGDSIEITVNFSQKIKRDIINAVNVTIKSLYNQDAQNMVSDAITKALHNRDTKDIASYVISTDGYTLKFSIPTETAKSIGFYGIKIRSNHVNEYIHSSSIKDFNVTYFQPKDK